MSPEKDYEEKGQLGALNRQDALDDYVRIRLGMPQSDHLSIRGRFRRGIMGQSKKKLRRIKALTGSASWPSIVGAAFFWIWMDRAMFGDTLLPDAASSAEHEALAWLAPLVILVSSCVALLLIVVALVRGNDDELWRWRMFAVCAAIGVVGGVAVTGGYLGSATPVCLAGCCLVGGAMAPLIILWGRVATAQGTQKTLTHISGAWALGLAGNLLLEGLLPVAAALSVGLMPLLSFAGYYVLFRLQGKATFRIPVEATAEVDSSCGRKSAKERLLGIRPSFIVFILVFCSVFGLMYGFEFSPQIPSGGVPGMADVIGMRDVTALLFFFVSFTSHGQKIEHLFSICVSLIAVGLLAMTVGAYSEDIRLFARICIPVGYAAFDILVWTIMAQPIQRGQVCPALLIAVAMFAEQVGITAGEAAGVLVGDYGSLAGNPVMLGLNYLQLVAVIGLMRMFRLDGGEEGRSVRSASSREGVKAEGVLDFPVPSGVPDGLSTVVPDNVRRLADDCGLTEREKEILALFAEGRSVPYIAEKFILSPNTVKTHMRRIYGKANVHSRQELLDKLEEIGR